MTTQENNCNNVKNNKDKKSLDEVNKSIEELGNGVLKEISNINMKTMNNFSNFNYTSENLDFSDNNFLSKLFNDSGDIDNNYINQLSNLLNFTNDEKNIFTLDKFSPNLNAISPNVNLKRQNKAKEFNQPTLPEEEDKTKLSNLNMKSCFSKFNNFKDCSEENENGYNDLKERLEKGKEWSQSEDNKLFALVNKYGDKNWDFISKFFDASKTPVKCFKRWNVLIKPSTVKGPWNIEEDKKLIDWIKNNGPCNWTSCASLIPGRTGKQCRERWANSLNPLLKKGLWEPEEDYIIFKLFKLIGSKWAMISNYLSGRTENSTKNRFYSTLRRYAGESVKQKNNNLKDKEKYKFDKLIEYFPIAYKDKTKDIDLLLKKSGINENEALNLSTLKEFLRDSASKILELCRDSQDEEKKDNKEKESEKSNTEKEEEENEFEIDDEEEEKEDENEEESKNLKDNNSKKKSNKALKKEEQELKDKEEKAKYMKFLLLSKKRNDEFGIKDLEKYKDFIQNTSNKQIIDDIAEKEKMNYGVYSLLNQYNETSIEELKKNLKPILANPISDKNNLVSNIKSELLGITTNQSTDFNNIEKQFESIKDLSQKIEGFKNQNQNIQINKEFELPLKEENESNDSNKNKKSMVVPSINQENITLLKNTKLGGGLLDSPGLIDLFKMTNKDNKEATKDKIKLKEEDDKKGNQSMNTNFSKMNNLFNQLNDLEELLKLTKTEIMKINI